MSGYFHSYFDKTISLSFPFFLFILLLIGAWNKNTLYIILILNCEKYNVNI